MAKRVNKPAVAALTLGLMVVLTAVGVLLVKSIPSRDVTPMVKSAEQAFAKQDYKGALTLYQTAYSRSLDIRWLVEAGKAAQELGDAGMAFQMWQTALVKDPSHAEARQCYVALWIDLIEMNDWHAPGDTASRVFEYSDALLAAQPEDLNGRLARGISSLAMRADKPELEAKGLEDLQKALVLRPDDERVLTVLGQYYLDVKKPAQAQKLYEGVIQNQKDNPVGYLLLGRLLLGQASTDPAKTDLAIQQLTKAVELSKDPAKPLVVLSQAYQAKKDTAKADDLLTKALQADPDSFDAYMYRSILLLSMEKPKDALKVAQDWLDKPRISQGFKANRYRSQRIRILLQAATASVVLASPGKESDKPNEEMLKQAERHLAEIDNEAGKNLPQALMVRADIQRLRGQNVHAIKMLEQADTAFNAQNPDVKLRLAELYRVEGNLGAAQKALATLSQLVPTYARAHYLQAVIAWQLNNRGEALSHLDKGLGLEPNDKDMLQLKRLIFQTMGSHERDIANIDKILGPGGTSVADKLQQAQRKLLDDRPEEAVALFREILAVEPAHPMVLRVMLQKLIQDGKQDEARQLFEKAKAAGTNPRIRDLEFLFAASLSPEQREEKILELIKTEPDPAVRNTQMYIYYLSRQKYDEAQKAVDALESAEPGTDRIIRMQFSLALARQDWNRAQKFVDLASQRDLDGADGGFLRAQMAMRQGDWAKAQSELEQALSRFPSHLNGWVWLAEAYMHTNQFDRAKDVLLHKALEINPTKGEAYKDLAYIAQQQAEQADYRTYMEKAIQYLPNDPWVVERGVAMRELDKPDEMIAARRKMLDTAPNDTENLVRLALLLERKSQYKEAGDLLSRAMSAAPKNLQIAWTAASFWQRQKDADRAEKIMVDVEQAAQGEDKAAADMLLGELYLQQGKADKAEQSYSVAAKISSNPQVKVQLADFYRSTGRIQDAGNVLRQAVQAADNDKKAQAQIRQKLVEFLLQSQKLTDAAAEIEAYHKALPDDSTYLLMRGTLLMMQGQTKEAVTALSDFLQKDRNSAVGLFHRGVLYLAMNSLSQAIEDLQAAKAASPTGFNFEHRMALAQALEANRQPDRAVTELASILQAYPVQDFRPSQAVAKALAGLYQRMGRALDFEALAEMIIAQVPDDWSWPMELGKFEEASGNLPKAIKGYATAVQASHGNPDALDNLLRVQLAAKQYDQVIDFVEKQMPEPVRVGPAKSRLAEAYFRKGQQDKARALYKQALQEASQSFAASMMVLRNVSQTLSPEESTEMLRQQLAAKPDDVPTKFLLTLVFTDSGKYDEAIPLSDQLLAAAKTDDDRKLVLRQRGSLLYQAGKFDEAAKAYEQMLTLVPGDSDTLNNLAYVFAENLNRPAEALPYARRAVELNPRNPDLLDTLGWVQYLGGDMDAAVGTLVAALQVAPNNVPARYHVGMVYKKKSDLNQAKREFEHAQNVIKDNPKDVMSRMFEQRVAKELSELAGPGGNVAGK